jgi:carbon-monoxide dehydrogenase large subunit
MNAPFIGQSLRRQEDARFVAGHGRFIEDIDLPDQLWMHVVRSPHAHALIAGIDAGAARAMPGVLGVFTSADLADRCPARCRSPAWSR